MSAPDPHCPICDGTGEISVMVPVYRDIGSPVADLDSRACVCTLQDNDEDYDDQE